MKGLIDTFATPDSCVFGWLIFPLLGLTCKELKIVYVTNFNKVFQLLKLILF